MDDGQPIHSPSNVVHLEDHRRRNSEEQLRALQDIYASGWTETALEGLRVLSEVCLYRSHLIVTRRQAIHVVRSPESDYLDSKTYE